MAEADCARVV